MRYRVVETREGGFVLAEQLGARAFRELKMDPLPELGAIIEVDEPHRAAPTNELPKLDAKSKVRVL